MTAVDPLASLPLSTVRVWDLPTRIFHWLLAVCVFASIGSAWIGGNAMVWHFRLGYMVFTLLAFRLLWGIVGGHWSRFATFAYPPATTLRYLRGGGRPEEHHEVGHNPVGAFSVFGLLALLAAQVATGLFADDEISNTGPLIRFVTGETSLALTRWHKGYGQWLIIAMVVLHIAAILYYLLAKRRDLVRPMLHGDKQLTVAAPAARDNAATRLLAALLVGLCAGGVAWVVSLAG
jgi:cytochrome b